MRGVNVNGRNMKMAEACGVFSAAGMEQVSSVLASGNIIFQSHHKKQELSAVLEKALNDHYKMESKLFIKDAGEIKAILDAVPYAPDPDWHVYAFICDPGFENTLAREFESLSQGGQSNESAVVNGGYFYWRVRKGSTVDTPFSKILGNRKYKEQFTSRNIGTIEKVWRKME